MARKTDFVLLKKDGKEYVVKFKWSVSRGRETYGYNICTAYVDDEKVGQSMGGGYDMQGAAIADWLEQFVTPEHKFYGLCRRADGSFYIDGGVGLMTILNGLGFEYKFIN